MREKGVVGIEDEIFRRDVADAMAAHHGLVGKHGRRVIFVLALDVVDEECNQQRGSLRIEEPVEGEAFAKPGDPTFRIIPIEEIGDEYRRV